MRALTLWQPWATLAVIGSKPFETRSWRPASSAITKRFAIHAAARPFKPATDVDPATLQSMRRILGLAGLQLEQLPRGAVVGSVLLRGAERIDPAHEFAHLPPDVFGDYSVGRWVWSLAEHEQLARPIPFAGRQGWFDVPERLLLGEER